MRRTFRSASFVLLTLCPLTGQTPAAPVDLRPAQQAVCRDAQGQAKYCRLGDTLYVAFTNLREWMHADPARNKPAELVLVLDGRVMQGLTARGPDTQYKELAFDLRRLGSGEPGVADNRAAWNALLRRSKDIRQVDVAVSQQGNAPYYGTAKATVQVFPPFSWLVVAFLAVLLVFFLVLSHRSDVLRDAPSPPGGPRMSFSLARVQMALWFFVIVASYNYIWMVTGDRDSLTAGVLILAGISATTGLGAVVVDAGKRDQRDSLLTQKAAVAVQAGEGAQSKSAAIDTALAKLPSPPGESAGFLLDILRDENGVSFHRFQLAVWTVVLGFVFLVSVYRDLAMPDFSATLLGLMGISSGTYLGFKIPDPPK